MKLEYKENINYLNDEKTFDQLLKELKCVVLEEPEEEIEKLFDFIIKKAIRKLMVEQFSTVRIIKDIFCIKQKNRKVGKIVQVFVVFNDRTYDELGQLMGCSRQYIFSVIKKMAQKYLWLKRLFEIKGKLDGRNRRLNTKGTVQGGSGRLVEGIASKKHQFQQKFLEFDFQGSDQ